MEKVALDFFSMRDYEVCVFVIESLYNFPGNWPDFWREYDYHNHHVHDHSAGNITEQDEEHSIQFDFSTSNSPLSDYYAPSTSTLFATQTF
jgi:hypothetical protein